MEKGISAREIVCAVLGESGRERVSIPGEVEVSDAYEYFDYRSKYLDDAGHKLLVPAPVTRAQTRRVQVLARAAFRALEGSGMARVDFLLDLRTSSVMDNAEVC